MLSTRGRCPLRSGASCRPLLPVAPLRSAGIASDAIAVNMNASPATVAAIGIARSVSRWSVLPGSSSARRNFWTASTFMSYSPFHVVFTVPEELAAIAHQNKAVVYNILFAAMAETLLSLVCSGTVSTRRLLRVRTRALHHGLHLMR